jgi:Flp pilus assembly protein TadD
LTEHGAKSLAEVVHSSLEALAAGDRGTALDAARQASLVTPKNESEWRALIALWAKLDVDLWIEMTTTKFLVVEPENRPAQLMLAQHLAKAWTRRTDAIAIAQSLMPTTTARDEIVILAEIWIATHCPDKAIELYRLGLQRYPDDLVLYPALCSVLAEASRRREARAAIMALAERIPKSASWFATVAGLAAKAGYKALAIHFIDLALKVITQEDNVVRRNLLLLSSTLDTRAQMERIVSSFPLSEITDLSLLEKLFADFQRFGFLAECEASAKRLLFFNSSEARYIELSSHARTLLQSSHSLFSQRVNPLRR